jgi:DNA-directed RNA polymerase subunit RPC12/RpoP
MQPKFRHKVVYFILRPFFMVYMFLAYGYWPSRYKLKGNYLILSNHVTMFDPFFLASSFTFPIYFVASNDIFAYKIISRIITYLVAPISKTKSEVDINAMREILMMAKNGGSIGLFLSGNSTYSGTEEYIDSPIAKLVKKINLPVIIYNLKGLYGVAPRWGSGLRRGYSNGEIKKIISQEELSSMSDEILTNTIKKGLNVSVLDIPESNRNYRGKNRAHFLERALFVCPDCKKISTLKSQKHELFCQSCGYRVTYMPNLTFSLNQGTYKLETVKAWYDFEKSYITSQDFINLPTNHLITSDAGIDVLLNIRNKRKEHLLKAGVVEIYNNRFEIFNNNVKIIISFEEIIALAVHAKNRLLINTKNHYYQVIGNERRSALKYIFIYYAIKNQKDGVNNGFLGI